MKSVRLSNAIRIDIADAMLKAWANKHIAPVDPVIVERRVGDALYQTKFGHLKSVMKKIPMEFFKKSGTIKVSVASTVTVFKMSEVQPHPYDSDYNTAVVEIFDKPTAEMKMVEAARERMKEWDAERKSFKEEIDTILASVTTTGQLVDLWPEAENYLPAFAADPSKGINLPALRTSRLNELLGHK